MAVHTNPVTPSAPSNLVNNPALVGPSTKHRIDIRQTPFCNVCRKEMVLNVETTTWTCPRCVREPQEYATPMVLDAEMNITTGKKEAAKAAKRVRKPKVVEPNESPKKKNKGAIGITLSISEVLGLDEASLKKILLVKLFDGIGKLPAVTLEDQESLFNLRKQIKSFISEEKA